MKTFDEALTEVALIRKATGAADEREQICAEAVAQASRARGIFQEAQANPHLNLLLETIGRESCCGLHAMLNAFVMGQRVGMAMERSETGGIAFDAVAPNGGGEDIGPSSGD